MLYDHAFRCHPDENGIPLETGSFQGFFLMSEGVFLFTVLTGLFAVSICIQISVQLLITRSIVKNYTNRKKKKENN